MILLTGAHARSGLQMLSGVLLDQITEVDFRKDVFSAFLHSGDTMEVVCERPSYSGGVGTTADGRFVTEFNTRLFGARQYVDRNDRPLQEFLASAIENRIELVTTADLQNVVYPAWLTEDRSFRPARTPILLSLAARRACDLPQVMAFAVLEPSLKDETGYEQPLRAGTTLPVLCELADKHQTPAALELTKQITYDTFEAILYHGTDGAELAIGATLENRTTIKRNPSDPTVQGLKTTQEFRATIGSVSKLR